MEGFENLDRLGETLVTNEVRRMSKEEEALHEQHQQALLKPSHRKLVRPAQQRTFNHTRTLSETGEEALIVFENSAKTLHFQLDGRAVFGAEIDRAANLRSLA